MVFVSDATSDDVLELEPRSECFHCFQRSSRGEPRRFADVLRRSSAGGVHVREEPNGNTPQLYLHRPTRPPPCSSNADMQWTARESHSTCYSTSAATPCTEQARAPAWHNATSG